MQRDLERGLEGAFLCSAGLFSNMVIFSGSSISEVITDWAPLFSLDKESILLLCRGMHYLSPAHPQACTMVRCLVNMIVDISAFSYYLCLDFGTRHGRHTYAQ